MVSSGILREAFTLICQGGRNIMPEYEYIDPFHPRNPCQHENIEFDYYAPGLCQWECGCTGRCFVPKGWEVYRCLNCLHEVFRYREKMYMISSASDIFGTGGQ